MSHALWGCSSLKGIRLACNFVKGMGRVDNIPFLDGVLLCKSNLEVKDFELLCIVFWQIWFRQNRLQHGGLLLSANEVIGWSKTFRGEFQAANENPRSAEPGTSVQVRWCPLAAWLLKLNVDAAILSEAGWL
ncbi:hypothetical protein ACOSQ3_029563 [Xanthoceras sorbifolium]